MNVHHRVGGPVKIPAMGACFICRRDYRAVVACGELPRNGGPDHKATEIPLHACGPCEGQLLLLIADAKRSPVRPNVPDGLPHCPPLTAEVQQSAGMSAPVGAGGTAPSISRQLALVATGPFEAACPVSVRVSREGFAELVLDEPELDPVAGLHHLDAILSQHPYDLEPVRPVVTFDLSRYKIAPEWDVVAGLDSRPDLVAMDPIGFEHLIRRLFEEIGLKSWVAQASREDGIDAVAVNEEPLIGGLCIIQAKRTKNVESAETVRSVAGIVTEFIDAVQGSTRSPRTRHPPAPPVTPRFRSPCRPSAGASP
ncbi:restriction endonuclease [Streptomyces scopuliridis]|uniref:restriction endonuclease n=1 Tax=Streptomyces scopuliridis TaxID=452529 RepID=UPI0035D79C1A